MPETAKRPERHSGAHAASARRAPRRRPRGELIAWGVLIALALGLRLYDLGARPFHHDESQDAYFSWILQRTATTSTTRCCTGRCAST